MSPGTARHDGRRTGRLSSMTTAELAALPEETIRRRFTDVCETARGPVDPAASHHPGEPLTGSPRLTIDAATDAACRRDEFEARGNGYALDPDRGAQYEPDDGADSGLGPGDVERRTVRRRHVCVQRAGGPGARPPPAAGRRARRGQQQPAARAGLREDADARRHDSADRALRVRPQEPALRDR